MKYNIIKILFIWYYERMIIMSEKDKDFLTDDCFDDENDSQNKKALSLDKEDTESAQQEFEEESSVETSEEEESNIFDEIENATEGEGYESQFGELEDFVDDNTDEVEAESATESKKQPMSTKKLAIIAVVAILAVAVIAFGVYYVFFNKSIKGGVWVPVQIDEATQQIVEPEDESTKQYYKFTNEGMIACYGNGYALSESSCNLEYNANSFVMQDGSNLTLNYEITGNLIEGKYLKLTIAGYEDQPITYKWAPFVKIPELTGPEFTKNEAIVGYWKFESGSTVAYKEFTEDGFTSDYVIYPGMKQVSTQKYNFDGKNLVTLSAGGTNMYYETIEPGTEEKYEAKIEGDKLIVTQNGYPIEFTKSTKEKYDEFEASALAGTYEYPTVDYSQYEELASEMTSEGTTVDATEAVTEAVTEDITE